MAYRLHGPSTYLQLICLKKTVLGKLRVPSVISMDTGNVLIVQENLLGTAHKRVGRRVEMNPLASYFFVL